MASGAGESWHDSLMPAGEVEMFAFSGLVVAGPVPAQVVADGAGTFVAGMAAVLDLAPAGLGLVGLTAAAALVLFLCRERRTERVVRFATAIPTGAIWDSLEGIRIEPNHP